MFTADTITHTHTHYVYMCCHLRRHVWQTPVATDQYVAASHKQSRGREGERKRKKETQINDTLCVYV